jgi:hypothetical protein
MALKSLRYHCYCPFNHKSAGISIPRPNLSYFLGTTGCGAPRMHCMQQVRWSKLPGLDPVSGSLDTVKSVVRAIPSSTETPDIHEGPPNLAESNGNAMRPIGRRPMKTLESGSPKKDCKTVCISVHRHYILVIFRDWPITRPRSSRKILSKLLLAIYT